MKPIPKKDSVRRFIQLALLSGIGFALAMYIFDLATHTPSTFGKFLFRFLFFGIGNGLLQTLLPRKKKDPAKVNDGNVPEA